MERIEIEQFKAALALQGVSEAIVPTRVFYLIGNTVGREFQGRDAEGNFIDVGPVRVRPLYLEKTRTFNSQESIAAFIEQAMRDVAGKAK